MFSLLHVSLDQVVERRLLELASLAVPGIGRADAARMSRSPYGILAEGLDEASARAFQRELRLRGVETLLVPSAEVPPLPPAVSAIRIEIVRDLVTLSSAGTRMELIRLPELVFVGGGYFMEIRHAMVDRMGIRNSSGSGGRRVSLEMRPTREERPTLAFRVDFFFLRPPYRIAVTLTERTVAFHQRRRLRMGCALGLENLRADLREIMPEERLSRGLLRPDAHGHPYPDMSCYEEEIRWHFHRLRTESGTQAGA